MRFGVLGPLEVRTSDGQLVRVPEAKVRALLADLLAADGRSVSADRLTEDLWGDVQPRNPASALQTRVWHLRRALDGAEPGARELVVSGPAGYRLSARTDAEEFRDLTGRARSTKDVRNRKALLIDALALWRGAAFADFADEEFTRAAITRLDEERLVAMEDLAEARLELGEHAQLVAELSALTAQHPLRERLRAAHITALYHSGRQSEALASYEDLRTHLRDQLGIDPGPALAELHRAVLNQDIKAAPKGNLPTPLTDLIGRETAVRRVRELLDRSRLVTLTGPGGVGKTRLAIAAASSMADQFPDGVWLVELSGLDRGSHAEVTDLVSTVVGVRDDPTAEPLALADRLVGAFRGKRSLLVLDNCEHLVEPVAELAERLLTKAPELHVLATSQEALTVTGELLWPVPPLEGADAVQLFAARAAEFTLTEGNVEAVAEICRRLDGLPLALELAATRVRALGVHELASRLDDRFRLLAKGKRGGPKRQQTLRAMIDWSWELLSDAERATLRRLAVFSDGCTLAAAEEICGSTVDLVARLVDRSLVTGQRFRLLESVGAYALDRLTEAGEVDETRRKHCEYYTKLAERAERHLRGRDQKLWLERLDAEAANLRAALDHADHDTAVRLVNALAWYWFLRGRHGEARRALARVRDAEAATWQAGFAILAHEEPDPQRRVREALRNYGSPRAVWFLGLAQNGVGDLRDSDDMIAKALAAFRENGDRWGEAAALSTQTATGRDLAESTKDAERSAELFAELGDDWGRLRAAQKLAQLAEVAGDYARAERLLAEALALAEDLQLWTEVSYLLSRRGRIALLSGDHATAAELHERARRIAVDQSHQRNEQFAEIGLGLGARRQGRLDDAERHLRAWLDWCRRIDGEAGAALILAELGFAAEQRGAAETALELHEQGLSAATAAGDPRAVALALEGLAGAHALAGRTERAARLLQEAERKRESVGAPLPPAERGDVDRVRARLTGRSADGG
ncbi:BTAD domain-containing putative transcriptional regulator [Allokutzneria oryzae]|uniref:BTAD domain-containing putative transcriptional regulator n=1 Tax=Allokutzneria oryzae TaxID=1378989 RepID=A0ABV6A6L8_9PSEU